MLIKAAELFNQKDSISYPSMVQYGGRQLEELKRLNYVGRPDKPEDIANMVAFLVSDEASYITGQNYFVGGARNLGV